MTRKNTYHQTNRSSHKLIKQQHRQETTNKIKRNNMKQCNPKSQMNQNTSLEDKSHVQYKQKTQALQQTYHRS